MHMYEKHSRDLALSPLAIAAAVSMLSYVRVLLHAPTELPHLVFCYRVVVFCVLVFGVCYHFVVFGILVFGVCYNVVLME